MEAACAGSVNISFVSCVLLTSRFSGWMPCPMGKEYKIKCAIPSKEQVAALFLKLPSPIHSERLTEIYNYRIDPDGFYFVDRLTDSTTASAAFRMFIDTALNANEFIEISEA
jgi:hypothetical protein